MNRERPLLQPYCDSLKDRLEQCIGYNQQQRKQPDHSSHHHHGSDFIPVSLLYGPPGTGKRTAVQDTCQSLLGPQKAILHVISSWTLHSQMQQDIYTTWIHLFAKIANHAFNSEKPCVVHIQDADLLLSDGHILSWFRDRFVNSTGPREPPLYIILTATETSKLADSIKTLFRHELHLGSIPKQTVYSVVQFLLQNKLTRNTGVGDDLIDFISNIENIKQLCAHCHAYIVADTLRLVENALWNLGRQHDAESFKNAFSEAAKHFIPSLIKELSSTIGIDISLKPPCGGYLLQNLKGLDQPVKEIDNILIRPWANQTLYVKMGIQLPKGILLYGPPGTGKTLLARSVANDIGFNFLPISIPDIIRPTVGESERLISRIFNLAKCCSPCIIFLDEIQSMFTKRTSEETNDYQNKVTAQLLVEMSNLNKTIQSQYDDTVLVLAATNAIWALDGALLRSGRFDSHILVPAPSTAEREDLLGDHLQKFTIFDEHSGQDLCRTEYNKFMADLVTRTEGYTNADIIAIFRNALLRAIRKNASFGKQLRVSTFSILQSLQQVN